MSLVFSAMVPHPPILIPAVGQDRDGQINATKKAIKNLEGKLFKATPDILIIISPHGPISPQSFTINQNPDYEINFESFGDYATKLRVPGEMMMLAPYFEEINKKISVNIISDLYLDHGAGVPLFFLTERLKQTKIIPITYSLLDNQIHYEFGKELKKIIDRSDKKIAVIASGDLSHCLTENAPAPFNPQGKKFDEKLIKLLKNADSQSIINLDPNLIEQASECGLKSLLILLGVLDKTKYQTNILSYEAPYGVGYLVANFKLLNS